MIEPHRPLIIAHRGASGSAPENTLVAFEKAIEFGAQSIEIDVQLSKDDVVVILHDELLNRTTNGKGSTSDHTLAELQSLDAGAWFSSAYDGQRIPTLHQVIQCVKGAINLDIEIKNTNNGIRILEKVIKIVTESNFENHCIISSFDVDVLRTSKSLAPQIAVGWIFDSAIPENLYDEKIDIWISHFMLITKEFVSRAKQTRKLIFAWTVNEMNIIQQMIDFDVDAIITDFPERIKRIIS